ncbi:hypothetical protein [Ottowia sp.]|uniref:hypothetical protein n=1 Tax=Ottowia sp. TaxID=1898956 RepID=UPI002C045202|nr:hypothetical protein [Ottowia sp.]HRN74734.1 hypothetical protein [Ottowia sp.]HRQ01886.1 hypothetical protein [Ottowia sp.]
MKKTLLSVMVITAVGLGACSTASKDVATVEVSPLQYQAYDCNQLAAESLRIGARVKQLGGRLDEAASNDKKITGVGVILFWPALFALGGTKEQEAEYGRLKGEYEAVQKTMVQKSCPGTTTAAAPVMPASPGVK